MSTADRTYSKPPEPSKGSPAFLYCYNPNTIWTGGGSELHTGAWVTLQLDSNGFLMTSVNNVVFSGTVNYGFTTLLTGNSITYVTGNPNVTISNPLLAVSGNAAITNPLLAVSGTVIGSVGLTNALLAVSGNANIINTAPMPFSGVVQANVTNTAPIPVSGVVQANITNTLLAVSGNATLTNTLLAVSGNTTFTNTLLAVSGNMIASGIFSPVFSGITSGQVQIPAGAKTWTITIESGTATYVNGTLFTTLSTIRGGNYSVQQILASPINIGTTGGRVVAYWE